eukprot:358726-Chlamydomonas_euryale.AAC.2
MDVDSLAGMLMTGFCSRERTMVLQHLLYNAAGARMYLWPPGKLSVPTGPGSREATAWLPAYHGATWEQHLAFHGACMDSFPWEHLAFYGARTIWQCSFCHFVSHLMGDMAGSLLWAMQMTGLHIHAAQTAMRTFALVSHMCMGFTAMAQPPQAERSRAERVSLPTPHLDKAMLFARRGGRKGNEK